jgi:hypothetical protein
MVEAPLQDVFVSYSSEDSEMVRPLVGQLRDAGVPVWIDEKRMVGGRLVQDQIERAIDNCKVLLLMASARSLESEWVPRETQLAQAKKKGILPIFLEPLATIPPGLRMQLELLHHIRWYANHTQAMDQILASLEELGVPAGQDNWSLSPGMLRSGQGSAPIFDENVAIHYLLSCSADGHRWQPLTGGTAIQAGSYLRVMVRAEHPCYLMLLVETLDLGGEAVKLDVFGPADEPNPTDASSAMMSGTGIWRTMPQGRVLVDSCPDATSAWRVGLLLQRRPPKSLLAALFGPLRPSRSLQQRTPEARSATRSWIEQVRAALPRQGKIGLPPIAEVPLPVETISGFRLDGKPMARSLAGTATAIHWTEVHFSPGYRR